MSTILLASQAQHELAADPIQEHIAGLIDQMIAGLPALETLTSEQRRGIVARYSAVLEGNFIYWMTATAIASKNKEALPILFENLLEECRDAHPAMMRRFAIAAKAFPTDIDALCVDAELTAMRLFLSKLQGVQSLIAMAFFEGWIQRFMGYLAALAVAQGSNDLEYTNVHGVCDVVHSQELFRAVSLEIAINPVEPGNDIYEGVTVLRTLIDKILQGPAASSAA